MNRNSQFLTPFETKVLERNKRIRKRFNQLQKENPTLKEARIFYKVGEEFNLSPNRVRTIVKFLSNDNE